MTAPIQTRGHAGIPGSECYQALVEGVIDYAILMLDVDGVIISWTEGARLIKGYSAAEAIGMNFSRFYPDEAVARGLPGQHLQFALDHGRLEDEGWRLRRDGSRFWANVLITRMLDERGQLAGYSLVTRDLTDRRKQDLRLRESEERFRLLVSGVKDYAIFMLDPSGHVQTWNTGAELIKGYAATEIIGQHFSRFYPPEAINRNLPETELRGAQMQGSFEDEGWRVRKDGSRFWANVIITAVRNASGQLIGFAKVTRDLSERRRQEQQLAESEQRFRLLVEGVAEYAIVMLNEQGLVTSWNLGAERINGYSSAEAMAMHISHLYPSEAILANVPWEHLTTARIYGRFSDEGWRVRKDGSLFWAQAVITALQDNAGRPYGFATITQDLTGRRHAEALADTAQRMHEFIAMLAHELRNPLAPIRNAVLLMGRKGLADPTLEAMRQTIDRQSILMARLVDDLLDVNRIARGQLSIDRHPLDIIGVINRAIETSRSVIEARKHHLTVSLLKPPLMVLGDDVRLTQAVVNLLNNAARYTAPGGQIAVSVAERGAELEIRVTDSGKGLSADMLEKIFDLFVQVEPLSSNSLGGLGVGLALVRRVVELHGGHVGARSAGRNKGAEFSIYLPTSKQQAVVPVIQPPPTEALTALRVMVVDDNQDAADTLNALLGSMGQRVLTAYDGESALRATGSFQPQVVLLDIGMPTMSGYEVARQLLAQDTELKPMLVAVTGWGQESDRKQATAAGFQHHLVKPIDVEILRSILREAGAMATS